jgi:hypothetical protein
MSPGDTPSGSVRNDRELASALTTLLRSMGPCIDWPADMVAAAVAKVRSPHQVIDGTSLGSFHTDSLRFRQHDDQKRGNGTDKQ